MGISSRESFYRHDADEGSFLSAGYNQRVLDEFYRILSAPTVRRICDVGSGAGSNVPLLNERFPESTLFTTDLNLAALRKGRTRVSSIHSLQSDALALPFPDSIMDLVVCTEVLEHVADLDSAFREIARILRPTAHAVISSPNYLNPMGLRKKWEDSRRGNEYWDPWGGHAGFERLMLPGLVRRAATPYFEIKLVRGAGYFMAWIPLGYRRIGGMNDRIPLLGLGRLSPFRDVALNRFLLMRKKASQ